MNDRVLRPLRVGEALDAAVKIYLRNAGQLVKTVLVVVVPFQVLAALIQSSTLSGVVLLDGKLLFPSSSDLSTYRTGQIVTAVIGVFVVLLANAACFRAVSEAYLGESPGWRESVGFGFRRLGSVFWLSLLTVLFLIVALIALVLPGIWLTIAWCVALPALLFEGLTGLAALRRSFALVRGRWWPTFGTLLVAIVILFVVQFVLGLVAGAIVGGLVPGTSTNVAVLIAVGSVLGVLSRIISTPFVAACVTVIYYDLRVRKEGLDLELLARGIGRPGAGPRAAEDAPAAPGSSSSSVPPPSTPPPASPQD